MTFFVCYCGIILFFKKDPTYVCFRKYVMINKRLNSNNPAIPFSKIRVERPKTQNTNNTRMYYANICRIERTNETYIIIVATNRHNCLYYKLIIVRKICIYFIYLHINYKAEQFL